VNCRGARRERFRQGGHPERSSLETKTVKMQEPHLKGSVKKTRRGGGAVKKPVTHSSYLEEKKNQSYRRPFVIGSYTAGGEVEEGGLLDHAIMGISKPSVTRKEGRACAQA